MLLVWKYEKSGLTDRQQITLALNHFLANIPVLILYLSIAKKIPVSAV